MTSIVDDGTDLLYIPLTYMFAERISAHCVEYPRTVTAILNSAVQI